jgi:putative selenium metabolism protein SsnA
MMENISRYIVGNGVVTDGMELLLPDGALLIADGKIEKVGGTERIREAGVEFIDVKGRLILPGLLNPHHHLYATFAVGLAPVGPTDSFTQILENFWWPYDRALDEESIYYAALLGIIDSIKRGATMIYDHHASMRCARGSLAIIEEACSRAGIKAVLCFETSDRMGADEVEDHIIENLEFHEKTKGSDRIKGLFGLHANFTLSDRTLEKVRERKPEDMPIHIHCGEDKVDYEYCRERGYQGPVHRLDEFGLLAPGSILAHTIHVSDVDYRIIEEKEPIVVSNPESNANNRVGYMDRKRITDYILGTDGMTGDMIHTLRSHYLLGEGMQEPLQELKKTFFDRRYTIQRRFFPTTGGLSKGMSADIAVLDYVPVTPVDHDNLITHLIFGAEGGTVYMTIADGQILYRDGTITFIEEDVAAQKSREVAERLRGRYYGPDGC